MSEIQNPKLSGCKRDGEILRTIEEWGAMNTDQVQAAFFPKIRYGQRKAQERLLTLYRREKLQRSMVEGTYCYYLDVKGMTKHLLGTNWIRLWMMQNLASWESLQSWSYEQDYKILRCDGFASIKNNMTGKFKFVFAEMDRGTNGFDKVQKYNKLFDQQETLQGRWWYHLTDVFPAIQVVTVSQTRKRLVQSEIEGANKNNLEFKVKLLDDVRREVMGKCCSVKLQEQTPLDG